MSFREYKMPFGKHKGETLEEIYVDDREYLDWAIENLENDSVREKIIHAVEDLKEHLRP